MRIGIAAAASLALCAQAFAEPVSYAVDGVAIGTQVDRSNAAYREYKCSPSEQFSGLTWCQKARTEKDRGKSVSAAYSLLHAPDGNVVYVNRSQEPSFVNATQAQQDIDRHSHRIGESPQLTNMPARSGLPQGMIATWGQVTIEPLDQASVKLLAEGKSPKKGLLIDFLGNFARSAKEGLPIYRIVGGPGFIWSASFDQKGRGALRTAAVDATGMVLSAPPAQAALQRQPAAEPRATEQPQVTEQPQTTAEPQATTAEPQTTTAEPQATEQPAPGSELSAASVADAGPGPQPPSMAEPAAEAQPVSPPQPAADAAPTPTTGDVVEAKVDRLALVQRIERLQDKLASAGTTIAELEKGKAAAQAAQMEAVKARRDAEKRIAQLEASGAATAPVKNRRWETALYGALGGLVMVLSASTMGFFWKRYTERSSLTNPSETPAQSSSTEDLETFVASPALAIAEDAFGRELEQQVAALNATTETQPEAQAELEAEPQAESQAEIAAAAQIETPVADEGQPKDIDSAPPPLDSSDEGVSPTRVA